METYAVRVRSLRTRAGGHDEHRIAPHTRPDLELLVGPFVGPFVGHFVTRCGEAR
jgi:hypothetical protein